MDPRQLFIERNNYHVHCGWACGKCGLIYTAKRDGTDEAAKGFATQCCAPYKCNRCGDETRRYVMTCNRCVDAEKLERILAGDLIHHMQVPESTPLFDWNNDRWYWDIGAWIEREAERLFEVLDECPDARPEPVLVLGEPCEWSPSVAAWLEHQEETYLQWADDVEPSILDDYREEIAAAQAIIDTIKPPQIWEGSSTYVDVRPLHDEVMRLAREWANG